MVEMFEYFYIFLLKVVSTLSTTSSKSLNEMQCPKGERIKASGRGEGGQGQAPKQ